LLIVGVLCGFISDSNFLLVSLTSRNRTVYFPKHFMTKSASSSASPLKVGGLIATAASATGTSIAVDGGGDTGICLSVCRLMILQTLRMMAAMGKDGAGAVFYV
jgi:hypothetical protein